MNNIILQNYSDLLKKVIFDIFSDNLKKNIGKMNPNENVMNYINLLSNLDDSLCIIAKESLIAIFETIDKSFKTSTERKRKFDIKSHHERTILTVFGEITFKRTFYTSKANGKNYCYLDRLLGLHKYDYFDPYLKALIVDYSANNSMPKTAKYINDLIGNRIKVFDGFSFLSRQTIRNIIKSAKLSNVSNKTTLESENIYIIADEKWIHTQNNKQEDVMEKAIVVFDNIKKGKLVNKRIFASLDNSFLDNSLDYIYETYNCDYIKNIFVMGDGASWIKNLRHHFNFSSHIKVIPALDKFHFKQALHHLCLNKELENILVHYVLSNNKPAFNDVCALLIKDKPHRSDTILEKKQYILNNWNNINNLYTHNLSCPMEAQISHILADLFTSRPKAYSINMINKLTQLRLLYKNNFNIKHLFLNNFNSNDILTINNEHLNFNIFDKKTDNLNLNALIPNFTYSTPFDNSYHSMKHFY